MRNIFLLLLFIPRILFSQSEAPYIYTSSDLDEALGTGVISYDQFNQLSLLLKEKVDINSGNLDKLLIIPGVFPKCIEEIERERKSIGRFKSLEEFIESYSCDIEYIIAFIKYTPSPVRVRSRLEVTTTHRLDVDYDPMHYIFLSEGVGDLGFNIRLKQRGKSPLLALRRSVSYEKGKNRLILGNFNTGWGEGLLVGTRAKLVHSLREDSNFLYPMDGWLNGMFCDWHLGKSSLGVIFSHTEYSGIRDFTFSPKLEYSGFGLSFLVERRDWRSSRLSLLGASIFGRPRFRYGQLFFETAYLSNGSFATNVRFRQRILKTRFELRYFFYSTDFYPLHSAGESEGSKHTIYPDSVYLETEQAGKEGAVISDEFVWGERKLRLEGRVYRDRLDLTYGSRGRLLFYSPLWRGKFRFIADYLAKGSVGNTNSKYDLRALYQWQNVSLYSKFGRTLTGLTHIVGYASYRFSYPKGNEFFVRTRWIQTDISDATSGYPELLLQQIVRIKPVEFSLRYLVQLKQNKDNLNEFRLELSVSP